MVTKEMIENSIEATVRKRNIRFLLIGFAVMFMVYFGILVNSGVSGGVFLLLLFVCIPVFGGFVLYQWIQYRLLFFYIEEYELYEVMYAQLSKKEEYKRTGDYMVDVQRENTIQKIIEEAILNQIVYET